MSSDRRSWLYSGTWPCGCVYIGQSVKPRARWSGHKSQQHNWAVREHFEDHGPPEWKIIGNEDGYPLEEILDAEETMIEECIEAGVRLLNRNGVDIGKRVVIEKGRISPKRRRWYERSKGMKRCSICRRRLDADSFNTDHFRSSGLMSRCRDCERLFQRIKKRKKAGSIDEAPYASLRREMKEWRDAGMPGDHPGAPIQ